MLDIQSVGAKVDEVFHRLTSRDFSDTNALLTEIAELTDVLKRVVSEPVPLPIKMLEELRLLGCATWNLTVRHLSCEEDLKERGIKAHFREFATRSFLIGNFVYSGKDVCDSYFSHHPRELEQCILMCLKTSRDLSLCHMDSTAKELLKIGEEIASHLREGLRHNLVHLKNRSIVWEFAYTMMDVTWNLHQYEDSSQASDKVVQLLMKEQDLQPEHRETFFRFVFTMANNTKTHPDNECYIRGMLNRSISVQNHFMEGTTQTSSRRHIHTLRGVTFQQMALSWIREGNKKEAMHWAKEADLILNSSDSALLRLRASAEAEYVSEAEHQLMKYVRNPNVTIEEAVAVCFEIQKLLGSLKVSGPVDGMHMLYTRSQGSSSSEYVLFRFVQLLLLEGSLASREKALQLLQLDEANFQDSKSRRFSFTWLWELSDSTDFTQKNVIQCLEAALRYKDSASETEIHTIHLRIAASLIEQFEDQRQHEETIVRAKSVLLQCFEYAPKCVFTHSLLLKVAILQGNESDITGEIECICSCEPLSMVQQALCTAINCFIKYGYTQGISLAAARALTCFVSHTNPSTELGLLRVYVTSILCKVSTVTVEQLCGISTKFCALLSDNTSMQFEADEMVWWVEAFLSLGSDFAEGPSVASVVLFRAAIFGSQRIADVINMESFNLLHASLLCVLEDEFQLFVSGHPHVATQELHEYLSKCCDSLASCSFTDGHITLLLAKAELHLREPSADTASIIENILKDLDQKGAAYSDYYSLADGSAYAASLLGAEYPFLYQITMNLYIHTAQVQISHTTPFDEDANQELVRNFITTVLSCFYEAYANAMNREEEYFVAEKLFSFLSSLISEKLTVSSFLLGTNMFGGKSALLNSASFVVLFLEYFTVELWNNAVFFLHLNDKYHQEKWIQITWSLLEVLPENSSVSSALRALRTTMSL